MARHIHFVDVEAPGKTVKGQPFNNKVIKGDFFEVSISYPADHRVKLPLRQMASLQVRSKAENSIGFKILRWELKNKDGNTYEPLINFKKDKTKLAEILQKEETIPHRLSRMFTAYYDIPPSVKHITIDIEIELTSPVGEKVLVKESIPLKQATFTTSFFEGLLH